MFINRPRNVKAIRRHSRSLSSPRPAPSISARLLSSWAVKKTLRRQSACRAWHRSLPFNFPLLLSLHLPRFLSFLARLSVHPWRISLQDCSRVAECVVRSIDIRRHINSYFLSYFFLLYILNYRLIFAFYFYFTYFKALSYMSNKNIYLSRWEYSAYYYFLCNIELINVFLCVCDEWLIASFLINV